LADDLGYADVGFNGCKDIPTPNIDALASQGVRFSSGYVSHPFCSPTRAALLTGRYQQRFGHENNPVLDLNDASLGLPTDQITLPQMLRTVGYQTIAVGKWHLGGAPGLHPNARGFTDFFGFLAGDHVYFPAKLVPQNPNTLLRNREPVAEAEYLTDALSREAVNYIGKYKAQPFFLHLAYNAVHKPLQASGKYLERFGGIADERRRSYAAMTSAMDDGIGRVLEALREHHLERNTLVVFISDNGGCRPAISPADRKVTGVGAGRCSNGLSTGAGNGAVRLQLWRCPAR
jgi:arylsulfatase A-like enzyme